MQDLASEIVRLQTELDREIENRRKELGWKLKVRMVEFEHGIAAEQRVLRKSVMRFLAQSPFIAMVTAPVIYSLILPMLFVDGWISLYQAICFRAYGIPRVRRSQYILMDRSHLAYLNWIEALNCQYCAYSNGVIAYAREIASRTEQYWCPIKHALRVSDPHHRYYAFLEYGDAEGYRARLDAFRQSLKSEDEFKA
jgi:hypothetical protein